MNKYEKEAFIKSFLLFFVTLILLNSIIFFLYYEEQKQTLHTKIFNELKIYNYNFKDKDIGIDIVPFKSAKELYILHVTKNEIFAYFDIPKSKKSSLKIIYPHKKYLKDINKIKKRIFIYWIISTIVLFLLSIGYSLYSIKPLKDALYLLEEFLKDIIHDLNTPVSSILLNLQIIKKRVSKTAIKRIELSAKTIGTLYENLETMIKDESLQMESIEVEKLIKERIKYYSYIYPDIKFEIDIKVKNIESSTIEFSRILDNLLSNACKYNKQNGFVHIYIDENKMVIEDSGVGIKNINRVFDRFYKESDRGLGLGMSIVKKLINKLGYKISIESKIDKGTKITVTFK